MPRSESVVTFLFHTLSFCPRPALLRCCRFLSKQTVRSTPPRAHLRKRYDSQAQSTTESTTACLSLSATIYLLCPMLSGTRIRQKGCPFLCASQTLAVPSSLLLYSLPLQIPILKTQLKCSSSTKLLLQPEQHLQQVAVSLFSASRGPRSALRRALCLC